jgi:hypothetical protein
MAGIHPAFLALERCFKMPSKVFNWHRVKPPMVLSAWSSISTKT